MKWTEIDRLNSINEGRINYRHEIVLKLMIGKKTRLIIIDPQRGGKITIRSPCRKRWLRGVIQPMTEWIQGYYKRHGTEVYTYRIALFDFFWNLEYPNKRQTKVFQRLMDYLGLSIPLPK